MWLTSPSKNKDEVQKLSKPKTPILTTFYAPESLPDELKKQRNTFQTMGYKADATRLNTFGGLVGETFIDTTEKLSKIPINIAQNTWEEYKRAPQKFTEDVKAGSEEFSKISKERGLGKSLVSFGKGIGKSGGRLAADAAIAIFAPISSAIGAVLNATGGQNLIDKTGEIIADKSGITDIKAFQKFAVEHPNAGEDFNRIMMLGMSGLEKGKIEPAKWKGEVKTFVDKIMEDAQPIAKQETPTTKFEQTLPDGREAPVLKTFQEQQGISRTSQKVAKEAIEADIIKEFPEMSKIETMVLKEQATKAQELIKTNRDLALEQIKRVDIPEVQKGAIFTELKKEAIKNADVETIRELSKTNIGTEAAQALKAFDDGMRLEADPVMAIKSLRKARVEQFEKTTKTKVDKIIKEEKLKYKEQEIDLDSWSGFIKSLEC